MGCGGGFWLVAGAVVAGDCVGVPDWPVPEDGGGADCWGGNFVADGAVGSCCCVESWAASPHGSAANKTRINQVFIRNSIIAVGRVGRMVLSESRLAPNLFQKLRQFRRQGSAERKWPRGSRMGELDRRRVQEVATDSENSRRRCGLRLFCPTRGRLG